MPFVALRETFPEARLRGLALCCGFMNPASNNLSQAKASKWWRDADVDEVVGALVADQYGEQAN